MFSRIILICLMLMSLEAFSESITHLYVFRHSETDRNRKGEEIQSWIDDAAAQLNENGIKGAHQLGKKLAELVPDAVAIISSDLKRSFDTATIVASYYATKLSIFKHAALREKCHGKWETLSLATRNAYCLQYYKDHEEELKAKQDSFAKWKIEPLSFRKDLEKFPQCQDQLETIYTVFERGSKVFKELGETYKGQKVLISSHGAFNDIMAAGVENLQKQDNRLLPVYFEPKARHFPKNCAVYHFTWNCEKRELSFMGEVSFDTR